MTMFVEEPFTSSADDQVDEPDRSDETNEVSPTWEPVADAPSTGVPSTEVADYDSDGDLDDVLDALADADTPSTFEALTVQDDPTSVSDQVKRLQSRRELGVLLLTSGPRKLAALAMM